MDPVALVMEALAAGAAAAVSGTVSSAASDAYGALKAAVAARLRGTDHAAVELYAADPARQRDRLVQALAGAGVAEDTELLTAAHALLSLIDPGRIGKYQVDNRGATGIQVGDGNLMRIRLS